MAEKNRTKNQDSAPVPEGMSRRQAKLAARAAEREALNKDPRPFGGLAAEADLVALREFVPSAAATLDVHGTPVTICTVLPGAGAGVIRSEEEGGERFVALQVASHSHNPGRDLAYALNWALTAQPGDTLQSTTADGTQPELSSLIDTAASLSITSYRDFFWWFPPGSDVPADVQQALARANAAVVPSTQVAPDLPGSIWWVNPGGGKAHIRWVRSEDSEPRLLAALARIAARGDLHLGEGTKFAGAFRVHGVTVPVWDLDPSIEPDAYAAALEALNGAIEAGYADDSALSPAERRQLDNIKSRQVTI
ncbi:hypothetical protein CAPI_08945 [Corynebacterium capitovis DSM 44611]|uniref:DUF5926 family protein n=1 Tax=Corynebacterium capitovis TaxID=131081 RepID=UPI00036E1915|nr:DUF5926 family protein [Corynebacterium capitovis]WKD58315.1 hypothetical protein CAPI_08945 [Corynebacterium capitovis DSM 44611]